jgi:hypothetical protein
MPRATGVNQPNILQVSHLKFKNEHVSEQMTQHWGYYQKSKTSVEPFARKWGYHTPKHLSYQSYLHEHHHGNHYEGTNPLYLEEDQ